MNRRFILRYLILIVILIICAGAAWYLTNASKTPAEDAVLAGMGVTECRMEAGLNGK